MITINYGISQTIPLQERKKRNQKRKYENHQGLQLDLEESQHQEIRDEIRKRHPSWTVEGYAFI